MAMPSLLSVPSPARAPATPHGKSKSPFLLHSPGALFPDLKKELLSPGVLPVSSTCCCQKLTVHSTLSASPGPALALLPLECVPFSRHRVNASSFVTLHWAVSAPAALGSDLCHAAAHTVARWASVAGVFEPFEAETVFPVVLSSVAPGPGCSPDGWCLNE